MAACPVCKRTTPQWLWSRPLQRWICQPCHDVVSELELVCGICKRATLNHTYFWKDEGFQCLDCYRAGLAVGHLEASRLAGETAVLQWSCLNCGKRGTIHVGNRAPLADVLEEIGKAHTLHPAHNLKCDPFWFSLRKTGLLSVESGQESSTVPAAADSQQGPAS